MFVLSIVVDEKDNADVSCCSFPAPSSSSCSSAEDIEEMRDSS
jgi:hypothetical protein